MFAKNPEIVIPVWDALLRGARTWAYENGFTEVCNMPHVAGASGSCESFQNTFAVAESEEFFGKKSFLVQSGQLYLEYFTQKFGKVFAEIQSFRREPDADDRHLCQFTLFEIEHLGYLNELMDNIEALVKACVREALPVIERVLPDRRAALEAFVDTPMQRISYSDAIGLLKPHFPDLEFGDDLKAPHEAKIVELAGGAVLNHSHPKPIKFFSMKENVDNPEVVDSCDLLLPFSGESAGAAERIVNYDDLVRRLKESEMYRLMKERGVKDEEFAWYLDQHKAGTIKPHSGAGIGMARVAQFVLGKNDIRESVPFLINSENLL